MSTTFSVSDVTPCEPIAPEHLSPFLDVASLAVHPQPHGKAQPSWEGIIQGSGCASDALITTGSTHPLVYTTLSAFARHAPLTLSPDHVWTTILQGLAHHIQDDPEGRRDLLVRHDGKLDLTLERNGFVLDDPTNDWAGLVDEFAGQIGGHLVSSVDDLLPEFSTTGPLERLVANATLMDIVHAFFDYGFYTLCGIPSVTLEGAPEDWSTLRLHAESLSGYDLGWWLDALRPILAELEAAAHGTADLAFWRSIIKHDQRSGGPYLTGWLLDLFPYLEGLDPGEIARNPGLGDRSREVCLSEIPNGLSRVSITWNYLGQKIPLELVTGFFGSSQHGATVRPELGWLVQRVSEPTS